MQPLKCLLLMVLATFIGLVATAPTIQDIKRDDLDAFDTSATGSADEFDNPTGESALWERIDDNIVAVRYCFSDANTRQRFKSLIESAVATWKAAIGPPSKDNGHALLMEEFQYDLEPQYCGVTDNWDLWNPKVSYDTVVILEDVANTEASSSTIGRSLLPGPWVQSLLLGGDHELDTIVHEWGHVLGMVHEHQRMDRDKYVSVRCEKLIGFAEAFAHGKNADPSLTEQQLCEDWQIAQDLGFWGGLQYMKGTNSKLGVSVQSRGPYDVDSVMHYISTQGNGDPHCVQQLPMNCPVSFWKDPDDHSKGLVTRWTKNKISRGDVAWIKWAYPWNPPNHPSSD